MVWCLFFLWFWFVNLVDVLCFFWYSLIRKTQFFHLSSPIFCVSFWVDYWKNVLLFLFFSCFLWLILQVLYCQLHRALILHELIVLLFLSMLLRNCVICFYRLKKYTFLYIWKILHREYLLVSYLEIFLFCCKFCISYFFVDKYFVEYISFCPTIQRFIELCWINNFRSKLPMAS